MKRRNARGQTHSDGRRESVSPKIRPSATTTSSQQPGGQSTLEWRHWLWGALLVASVILAYCPAWTAGFIWDDDVYVIHNKLLTEPGGLARIWFSQESPSQYFPLVYSVLRLERAIWGLHPAGYHWVNILIHAANSLLVWRILCRLRVPGCWLAAALFALHPVQVETVAWVTELKNVLSLLFFLLSLSAWLRFLDNSAKRWQWYFGAVTFYSLALFSKTTACTMPAALVLVLWLTKRPIDKRRIAQIIPFVLLGLSMGLVTIWWERHHIGTSGETFSVGVLGRVLIASHAAWFYLAKLVWPVSLAFSYPRFAINLADPLAYGWLVAGILSGVVIYYCRRRTGRSVEVAALFFLATLSPLLGFIMLYTFKYTFVADHYQYAAAIGPLALAAAGIARTIQEFPAQEKILRPIVFGTLMLVLGSLTWHRAKVFQNVESVWRDTIAKNPKSWLAYSSLGDELIHRGEFDEAMEQYDKAIELNPNDVNALVSAGNALFGRKRYTEAMELYTRALRLNPNNPESHVNLAVILANEGRMDEAIEHDHAALKLNPRHVAAHVNLAVTLARQGKYPEALEHYREAIAINPERPLNRINMAITLDAMGRHDEAREQFQIAARAVNKYAENLAQQGRQLEAEAQYSEAIRMIPENAEAHFGLGVLLMRYGKESEAKAHFEQALKIRPDYAEARQFLRQFGTNMPANPSNP
jgi:tetratricopeptide (TPR) repeat protein